MEQSLSDMSINFSYISIANNDNDKDFTTMPINITDHKILYENLSEKFKNEEIEREFTCPICLYFVYSPKLCEECEVLLCCDCSEGLLNANTRKCPNCKADLKIGRVQKSTRNVLNSLIILCPNNCMEEVKYENYSRHLQMCPYTRRICECAWCKKKIETTNEKKEIREHLEVCEEYDMSCTHCLMKLKRKEKANHEVNCDYRPIICEDCGDVIMQMNLNLHSKKVCIEKIKFNYDELIRVWERLNQQKDEEITRLNLTIRMLQEDISRRNEWEVELDRMQVQTGTGEKEVITQINSTVNMDNNIVNEESPNKKKKKKKNKNKTQQTQVLNHPQISLFAPQIHLEENIKPVTHLNITSNSLMYSSNYEDEFPFYISNSNSNNKNISKVKETNWHISKYLFSHKNSVNCVIHINWKFDKYTIVSGSSDRTIKVWEINEGKHVRSLEGHTMAVKCLLQMSWDKDNTTVVSGGEDGVINVWNIMQGSLIKSIKAHSGAISDVIQITWKKNQSTIASAGWDQNIKLWDVITGNSVYNFMTELGLITSLLYFKWDGWDVLVSTGLSKTIEIFPIYDSNSIATLAGHEDSVYKVIHFKWEYSKTTLVSCSADTTVKIWDLSTQKCFRTLTGHQGPVYTISQLSLNTKDDFLISGGEDKTLRIWSIIEGVCIKSLPEANFVIYSTLFIRKNFDPLNTEKKSELDDIEFMITAGKEKSLQVWKSFHNIQNRK